jgi:biopolymer transport protein ExbD
MRPLRRTDISPRLELTPLLDVVFLLLTFFIYCVVMMFHVEVLPVKFTSLAGSGGAGGSPSRNSAVTLRLNGELYFNRDKITLDQLDARLAEVAKQSSDARVYVAMEAPQGLTDRGPLYQDVLERVYAAGLQLVLVGEKPAVGRDTANVTTTAPVTLEPKP